MDDELRASKCDGKQAFSSAALAHKIVKRQNWKAGSLNVYRCEFCGQFHIGNKTKSKFKRNPKC